MMLSLWVIALVLVAAALVWRMRPRNAALPQTAINTPASVANGGLTGQQQGYIRWRGALHPARISPRANRDVMASGTAVMIETIEDGVALVVPK